MMFKPAMNDILKKDQSYYSLVIAVAKRAREIAEDAEANHQVVVEKPVRLAVEEFARGEYYMTEDPGLHHKNQM